VSSSVSALQWFQPDPAAGDAIDPAARSGPRSFTAGTARVGRRVRGGPARAEGRRLLRREACISPDPGMGGAR